MNRFLSELCAWLDADRLGRKVLFVRNTATGNQLLRMAANHGTPAVNVQAVPVHAYINQLAEGELVRRGLQKADAMTSSIALQDIMRDLGGGTFTTMGKVELTTASRMLPQLEELEANGLVPADLERAGQPLLAQVWDAFLSWKKENRYVLESELTDLLPALEDARFALLSNVPLSKTEQDFLSRIPSEKLTVIRVEVPAGESAPRNTFFAGDPVSASDPFSSVSCVECQDIGTEVRAAFQYLIENRIAGEDAVFVCPDDRYGMRAEEEGKLLEIPVDSAFGKPASMTGTALVIRCLLDWAASDYDVESLTPALISGCMAVYDEAGKLQVYGQEMLRTFRQEAVGWSRRRWEQIAASEKERYALAGQSVLKWVLFFDAAARPVRTVASELVDLIGGSVRRGNENEVYLNIIDGMSRIYSGNMTGKEFLELVQEVADGLRVDAHPTDMPGRVYCCSYENAMYADRKHFILLGMSWDAFNKLGDEFPLLHDEEKAKLSPRLRLVSDRASEKRYAVLELLLNRTDASVIFSRARSRFVGGEDILGASLFDDVAAKYAVTDPATGKTILRVPQANILERKALSESDVRMQDGCAPGTHNSEIDEGRPELWKEESAALNWSATRMENALSCPRKFVFQTLMGIDEEKPAALERFGQKWLDSLSRGNLVHEVLDAYFRQTLPRLEQPDEDLLGRLVDEKIDAYKKRVPMPDNLMDVSAEVKAIRKVVKQVAGRHAADTARKTVGTEISFGEEEPVLLSFGPHEIRIRGRIDRVDQVADGYEVIDYKTGNPYYFRRDFADKLQYYLYTVAWEKLHPDRRIVRASYDLLDGPGGVEQVVIEMTGDLREQMYNRVTALLDLLSDPENALLPAWLTQTPDGEQRMCNDYCIFWELCHGAVGKMLGDILPDEAIVKEEE